MTYLTYIGTCRENTGNGPAKKVQKYLAKTLQDIKRFCKLALTTNASRNAESYTYLFFHYISGTGDRLRLLQHSWLSVAFPRFFFFSPSKDNHK